jgi:hypothetical protein
MWRRLHDEDDEIGAAMMAGREDQENADKSNKDDSPKPVISKKGTPLQSIQETDATSDDEYSSTQRSTAEAAKILADCAQQPVPASASPRVLLAISSDKEWISDMDCYVRKQLELFAATEADVEMARADRKFPIEVGQVGIRCIQCAMVCKGDEGCSGTAVSYPFQIHGIYEAVRELQRLHLDSCVHMPTAVKDKISASKGASSLSSVLRRYYALAAKALGLYDFREGVRAGGECVPIGAESASFSFTESESPLLEDGGSPASQSDANKRHESPNGPLEGPAAKKTKGGTTKQATGREHSDSEAGVGNTEQTTTSEHSDSEAGVGNPEQAGMSNPEQATSERSDAETGMGNPDQGNSDRSDAEDDVGNSDQTASDLSDAESGTMKADEESEDAEVPETIKDEGEEPPAAEP